MTLADVPFGEWLPSNPSFKNPGCEVADNCIPIPGGYGPLRGLTLTGSEVSDTVKGARQFFDNSGNSVIVGGTDTKLFIRRSTITETTGYTSIGTGAFWDFCRFNDFVIATSEQNSPQYLTDIDSDNTWSSLTGSPPNAKVCAKVNEFLILGAADGVPNRIQWSPFNDPAGTWGTDRQTQAGLADLDSQLGGVQKIVGGRYAVVFQERGIQRLSYIGPPVVFRADVIEQDRGCVAPFSVATVGYVSYFLAQDGFYVTDGSSVAPIGTNRVNKWFFENADQDKLAEVQSGIDWHNESVFWLFAEKGTSVYGKILIYSWAQKKWSSATVTLDSLVGTQVDGVDLDSLDAIYTDLDSMTISLDSAELAPGARVLAGFVSGEYATFDATPLEATWETAEGQPAPAKRVFADEVYPLMDADDWDMKAELIMRDNRGALTYSGLKSPGWSGFCPVRGEGMKMAIRAVKPSGEWRNVQGVQVNYVPAGAR